MSWDLDEVKELEAFPSKRKVQDEGLDLLQLRNLDLEIWPNNSESTKF